MVANEKERRLIKTRYEVNLFVMLELNEDEVGER
jgi:hypothetical protein